MRTTIDEAGRLVLPKEARDQLGLKAGDEIEIQPMGDGLHLRLVHESPRLVKKGHVLVFTGGQVEGRIEAILAEHRQERIDQFIQQTQS